ncbi:MAG: hypothetical protein ABUL73_04650 [Alphaproteobacteria bacterium]
MWHELAALAEALLLALGATELMLLASDEGAGVVAGEVVGAEAAAGGDAGAGVAVVCARLNGAASKNKAAAKAEA